MKGHQAPFLPWAAVGRVGTSWNVPGDAQSFTDRSNISVRSRLWLVQNPTLILFLTRGRVTKIRILTPFLWPSITESHFYKKPW